MTVLDADLGQDLPVLAFAKPVDVVEGGRRSGSFCLALARVSCPSRLHVPQPTSIMQIGFAADAPVSPLWRAIGRWTSASEPINHEGHKRDHETRFSKSVGTRPRCKMRQLQRKRIWQRERNTRDVDPRREAVESDGERERV